MVRDADNQRGVPIRAVSRTLSVLKVINANGALSMSDVARMTRLPYATAVRLVATLLDAGMVECEPHRKYYRLSAAVLSLSNGFDDSGLRASARPYIDDLTLRHGCAVTVSTRFGPDMVVQETTHSAAVDNVQPHYAGFVYPMLWSASGLAYLAFMQWAERRDVMRSDQSLDGQLGLVGSERLDLINAQGFATEKGGPGRSSAVAAPIFAQGRLLGTVALKFSAEKLDVVSAIRRYAGDVVEIAEAISARMSGE
jgi:IclR family mhp operon transcriptional activator